MYTHIISIWYLSIHGRTANGLVGQWASGLVSQWASGLVGQWVSGLVGLVGLVG